MSITNGQQELQDALPGQRVDKDLSCRKIAEEPGVAAPLHCLARGPPIDRTKTVPNTSENTGILAYWPYLTSLLSTAGEGGATV
jgi:hypothetical protein